GVHQASYFTARRGPERSTAGIAAFLLPGCGFGGSCLPKDVAALVGQARGLGLEPALLQSVLAINRGQADEVMKLIARHYPAAGGAPSLDGVNVTTLGIAFKPDTDDVRESPAFPIIARLRAAGARVMAYDPVARPAAHAGLAGVSLAATLEAAVAGAEIVVLVTRWPEFSRLAGLLRGRARPPLVVDGRRMLEPSAFARYEGIGL
ncbi:MAG: UDP-glucose/GDP-mannose dehydrogenase family protein, partial [Gammaproteobacteria bacterium]|nr:UDP-glucose/GDP-mannose dehydrogenase family protein [Gammaproteobacteria bacterium]